MEATESATAVAASVDTIGNFIRRRRDELGISQAELGRKLGRHQVWVSQRECGNTPVRSEDLPGLADALQVDAADMQHLVPAPVRPSEAAVKIETPVPGVVTKESVTTEVLRWQVGERSIPIDELNREELLDAMRSLFATNGRMKAEFDADLEEIAQAYEQRIQSLHNVLAARVELEMREALRDKMDAILEVVIARGEQRQNDSNKEDSHGY
ncbi:MAG: helix-turn-helix transcriptional regulator [Isosphaeraceae bacterium]